MSRYVMVDGSPPDPLRDPPSYVYRDARDCMVTYPEDLIFTGLYNDKGGRIMRAPREIGFNRE